VAVAPEYLRRPAGVEGDDRVPFKPDVWQKRLLDIVDSGNSCLCVAPTASGKTFIAYYVMEMCLRANDTDVVVYVAPSAALVDQVYHEIQARFTKRYTGDMHLTGIFNTSYREQHLDCQILVAEPECLEIMLTDPANSKWAKGIRHVIFDEVHSVGLQGGETWERLLLYTSAPFLGLSATLGDVESFRAWLERVEKQRERDLYFVNYAERHNDLAPYLWTNRTSLDEQIVPMHPLWAIYRRLTAERRFEFPLDFKLLPEHCTQLLDAMLELKAGGEEMLALQADTYFQSVADHTFNISMRNARDWEQKIKACFCGLDYLKQRDVLELIIKPADAAANHTEEQLKLKSERVYLTETMLPLVRSLQVADMLPCIVFHMTRDNVVRFAKAMETQLRAEELEAQEKEGHMAKVEKQEKKVKDIQKGLEKMGWSRDKAEDEPSEEVLEALQELSLAENKLAKLKSVDPRFALIPPGMTQVTADEINSMVASGRRSFFNPKDALHLALLRGIGCHHAGLPRSYRQAVERLFRMKRLSVVISTETLSMGINMPTRTSVFAGDNVFLNSMVFRQMAGRSGRRGFDLRGNIIFTGVPADKIRRLLNSELPTLQGNLLMTATFVLRMLVKHASIRTQAEADIMAQNKKVEAYVDQMDENIKEILTDWRADKNIVIKDDVMMELAGMSPEERAKRVLSSRDALKSINSRDLATALVEMDDKERPGVLKQVIDDRSGKHKQKQEKALEDCKFATAAKKKLNELLRAAEDKNEQAIADEKRIAEVRGFNAEATRRMVNTPLFRPNGDLMGPLYAHSFRFCTEYLQKEGLLDAVAAPRDVSCIMAGLFNAEPANFAAVNFLRSRVLEKVAQLYVEKSDGSREPIEGKTELQVMERLVPEPQTPNPNP
jgi:superfamily II RNA helicase